MTLAMTTALTTEVITSGAATGGDGVSLMEFFYKGWLGLLFEDGKITSEVHALVVVLCGVMGYLLGSINFAVVISRLRFRDDIRKHGSGNAGATNMMRTYGKGAGVATLLGDIFKAMVAVLIARILVGDIWAYMTGFCCALGHAFPCYYKFKGGKCVAVTAAIALVMEPFVFLLLLAIFAVMVIGTKYVSLGSIFAALMYPVIQHNIVSARGFGHTGTLFVMALSLLVVFLHRENIKRLLDGKENKINLKKGKKDSQSREK